MTLHKWTVGEQVLYWRGHDTVDRTIARVLPTQVVIDTGERFTHHGVRVGYADRLRRPRIDPATPDRLAQLRDAQRVNEQRTRARGRRVRITSLLHDLTDDELQPIVDYLRQKGLPIE